MLSCETRHQSYLPTSEELMTSPISPFDPEYPFFSEYPSPAESDTLETPFFTHYAPTTCQETRIHSSSNEEEDGRTLLRRELSRPHCFPPLSPTRPHKDDGDFLPFPELASSSRHPSPLAQDTFRGSYSDIFHDFDDSVFHSTSPVQVVVSNPSNLDAHPLRTGKVEPSLRVSLNIDAGLYSPQFPPGHRLNPQFVRNYQLGDELGSGGYGFVMTARHRAEGHEVAVKFVIKRKVPDHSWVEDETIGRLPTEVMLLSCIDHENIVKCLDLFEDSLYFYLVQELHGSPWPKHRRSRHLNASTTTSSRSHVLSTPSLSPSVSTTSLNSSRQDSSPSLLLTPPDHCKALLSEDSLGDLPPDTPTIPIIPQREYFRRPSHDLFECIEQSENKRLSEKQARHVFSQVVDAVHYLDSNGIAHRDIKDENIVIDRDLKVKLIDFGSATIVDPNEPRPYYTLFYGTTAYASPEILMKKEYQAAPAEIWTLGVLLSYLLTGTSPFPTVKDAINGRIVLADVSGTRLSRSAMSLLRRCLDPDPRTRATITEVKAHRWLW